MFSVRFANNQLFRPDYGVVAGRGLNVALPARKPPDGRRHRLQPGGFLSVSVSRAVRIGGGYIFSPDAGERNAVHVNLNQYHQAVMTCLKGIPPSRVVTPSHAAFVCAARISPAITAYRLQQSRYCSLSCRLQNIIHQPEVAFV